MAPPGQLYKENDLPTYIKGNDTSTFGGNVDVPQIITDAPAFAAYLSANQSISSSTWTKAALNTELYDTTNAFDSSSTYKFTPQVEGYYQVNVNMSWVGSSVSRFISKIDKNGSAYCQVRDGSGNTYFTSGSQLIYMNGSTDYLEFYAYIVGTSVGIEGGSTYRTLVSASLVRAV